MIAFSLLPHRFEDGRHDAIEAGMAAAGYAVHYQPPHHVRPGDVLLTWNAYGNNEAEGRRFREGGGKHIVCEEAYIREIDGERHFAMALWGHNGSGEWYPGGPERWAGWRIPVAPWRESGNHILVCGQRGFGYNSMAMPDAWPDSVFVQLRAVTDRPIWFRPHPKRRRQMPRVKYDHVADFGNPITDQLRDCWAVVVYTSNAATDALLAGVPAFYCGPSIVTAKGSCGDIGQIERDNPRKHWRRYALERMAWAQWSVSEIVRGDAARHLLQ